MTATSSAGARTTGRERPPHTRSTEPSAAGEQALRPHEQHDDDEAEEERRQVLALRRRERPAEQPGHVADREAAERRGEQPVHPAQHHAGEHDDRLEEREVLRDDRLLDGEQHRDDGGQQPRDQHRRPDDAVRAHPEQAGRLEVHRGRTHLQPDRRAPEKQHQRHEADRRRHDRDDGDLAHVRPEDAPRLDQLRERGGRLAERIVALVDQQRHALQQERDREGGDEHRRRRLRSQRPEDDPIHRQGQAEHDGEAERDPDPDRPVLLGRERERERARHDQLAVGEVDEAQHAEDETDPDRHQREDRPLSDCVDLHLRLHRRAQEVGQLAGENPVTRGTRGSAGRCRPRRRGSGRGGARRWRARATGRRAPTVRWARCSTSRIAIPCSRICGERLEDHVRHRRVTARATARRAAARPVGRRAPAQSRAAAAGRRRARPACRAWNSRTTGKSSSTALDVLGCAVLRPARREPEPEVLLDRELPEDAPPLGHERHAAARDVLGRLAADGRARPPARRPLPRGRGP